MQAPLIPIDEAQRLEALHRLLLLDTPAEESFDRVTRLASVALGVPIMLVSLVDENRQWFKSCVGLDATETSREFSFCGHVIYERRPLNIPDATRDPRFAGNPLVTGAPYVRAYLGIPLFTVDAQPIGTLCAIDVLPRHFTQSELDSMRDFAGVVEEIIKTRDVSAQARGALRYAARRERLFRDTFEEAAVGIVHATANGRLQRVNQRACELLGFSRVEMHSKPFLDLMHRDETVKNTQLFRKLVAGEIRDYRLETRFIASDGAEVWVLLAVAMIRNEAGKPDYVSASFEDISEHKSRESTLVSTCDSLTIDLEINRQLLENQEQELNLENRRAVESQRALRIAGHRLRSIASGIPAMLAYWNRDLRCEFANESHRQWFGLGSADMIGMSLKQFLGGERFAGLEPAIAQVLEGKEQHYQRTITRPDRSVGHVDARYWPDWDECGEVCGFYVFVIESSPAPAALDEA
jgi:PAS domain S-box-containing protein